MHLAEKRTGGGKQFPREKATIRSSNKHPISNTGTPMKLASQVVKERALKRLSYRKEVGAKNLKYFPDFHSFCLRRNYQINSSRDEGKKEKKKRRKTNDESNVCCELLQHNSQRRAKQDFRMTQHSVRSASCPFLHRPSLKFSMRT